MFKRKRSSALNVRRKNRIKVEKTIVQVIILLVLGALLFDAIFTVKRYEEPDKTQWTRDSQGFIALSYFGVGRSGTPKLVAKNQLDEQLKALYDQGYQTISQQDIIDYYTKGTALPEKALFLSFEDGRNDSSLFAQPLLEDYNYKATILSYANKMGTKDHKFIQSKEMLKMTKTGYWELGTNGYRLSYINVFDKAGRYIGMKDEQELTNKENVGSYNHYLMDFIRDENSIPVENREEMEARIKADYNAMRQIYTESLGYVPSVYMIMHANALGEGMNRLVSEANTANIRSNFKIHFNREGQALNTRQDSIYDLTRVQPAPYWSTNHLLMKIQKDTGQEVRFVEGNEAEAKHWSLDSGAVQFKDNEIILTSPPGASGKLTLKEAAGDERLRVSAQAAGNVVGKQSIYVRDDRQHDSFVRVVLDNNEIRVEQKQPGASVEILFSHELEPVSWSSEDLTYNKASVYTKDQTGTGESDDEGEYPIQVRDTRTIEVTMDENLLKLTVDKQVLLDGQQIAGSIDSGSVSLESEFSEYNKKDDIYDAVFKNVQVFSGDVKNGKESLLYSNQPSGLKGLASKVREAVQAAVNWAIDTF